jgi:hypothetical protein
VDGCADARIADLHVRILLSSKRTSTTSRSTSTLRSRSASSRSSARDGEQAEEDAARHEALFEKGCTRRS